MEPTLSQPMHSARVADASSAPSICSVCHQPVKPEYYFCPNCGNQLHKPPLSTTPATQAWIYLFSIVLPFICFIMITKWPGMKYAKSQDPTEKNIGVIAWILLISSTILTLWLAYIWTLHAVQSSIADINLDMSY